MTNSCGQRFSTHSKAADHADYLGIQQTYFASFLTVAEDEVAFVVTERLLNPSIISYLQLPDDYEIAEIKAPKAVVNRSLTDIGLRNKYHLTLVTIKREFEVKGDKEMVKENHILGVPNSETIVYETDTLVVFGTRYDVARFIEINQ